MACQQRGTYSISVAFTTFSSYIKGPIKVPVKLAVKAASGGPVSVSLPSAPLSLSQLHTADTSDKDPLLNLAARLPVYLDSGYPDICISLSLSVVLLSCSSHPSLPPLFFSQPALLSQSFRSIPFFYLSLLIPLFLNVQYSAIWGLSIKTIGKASAESFRNEISWSLRSDQYKQRKGKKADWLTGFQCVFTLSYVVCAGSYYRDGQSHR